MGSVTIALLAMEGVVRLLPEPGPVATTAVSPNPRGISDWYQPDFRDRRFNAAYIDKQEGTFRVVAVGDSFTWGDGVHASDAWPDRLETRVRALGIGHFEVWNWSRRGWNTEAQWRSLQRRILELEPDLILLGYMLNDPQPRSGKHDRAAFGLQPRQPASAPGRWIHGHSQLFQRVYDGLENRRIHGRFADYYTYLHSAENPSREAQEEALRSWAGRTQELGIPMVVVVFPVFTTEMGDSYPYGEVHELVIEQVERLGLRGLDLQPVYSEVQPVRLPVEPFLDRHPNELAHRMAADAILEFLLDAGLLPVD